MSDKYINLTNFRYGLDGRRDALTSILGTLVQVQNAHINAGGEVEQRMSFAKDANLYPTNTFGLQDTDSGLQTYGSAASAGGTLPTGVTYVQLAHPTSSILPMDSVVYSCNFLGKAFVLTHYTGDNAIYAFYNSAIVKATSNGITIGFLTLLSQMATDLAAEINAIPGWSALANKTLIAGVITSRTGSVIVASPIGIHFTPIPSWTSISGIVGAVLIDQNLPGTAAHAAAVAFTLNAGTNGTVTVSGPANSTDASHTEQISGGAIPFNTSLTQTAADVVTAINLFSGTTGYHASQNGTTITVYAPTAFGAFGGFASNQLHVVTTGDITTTGGTATNQFSISIAPNPATRIITVPASQQTVSPSIGVQASTRGAAGATSFTWAECNPDGTTPVRTPSHITANPDLQSGASCQFSFTVTIPGATQWASGTHLSVTGYFKAVGTDAGGAFGSPQTLIVPVTLGFQVP